MPLIANVCCSLQRRSVKILVAVLTLYPCCRRTDPDDKNGMLFYLLIKKDGTSVLPGLAAVHADVASSSAAHAPDAATSALPQSVPQPHQADPPSEFPAPQAAGQSASCPAVVTTLPPADYATRLEPSQPPVQASAADAQPTVNAHQGHALEQKPSVPVHSVAGAAEVSGSGSHLSDAAPAQAAALPQVLGSALNTLLQPTQLIPTPSSIVPHSATCSPQLVPFSPQLQPQALQLQPQALQLGNVLPQLPPASPSQQAQAAQQQVVHVAGMHHDAAPPQDISKQFLALLHRTSSHLAGSQQPWPGQQTPSKVAACRPALGHPGSNGIIAADPEQKNDGSAGNERCHAEAEAGSSDPRVMGEPGDTSQHGQTPGTLSVAVVYTVNMSWTRGYTCNDICGYKLACKIHIKSALQAPPQLALSRHMRDTRKTCLLHIHI